MVLNVERRLETDFEGLKLLLNVETCFEVRFEGANEKLHVHAISRREYGLVILIVPCRCVAD